MTSLSSNQINRTIIINEQSAGVKADLYLFLQDYVKDIISEHRMRTAFNEAVNALDKIETVPQPAGAEFAFENAVSVITLIKSAFPDYIAKATKSCINASNYMAKLQADLQKSSYAAFEVRLILDRYTRTDGKIMEIPIGGTVVGMYTKTGEKATF